MNFIEYLGIVVAPSLTLGLVIFLAKNWFLERLKNSVKHEYDLSLEKFKGDLKHDNDKSLEKFKGDLKIENDKELEEIKALLKNQTDVSLEDYRFQIEIRKKWLNDVRDASIEYLTLNRRQTNVVQEFGIKNKPVPRGTVDEHYNKSLEEVSKITVDITSISFKLEILIAGFEPFDNNIIASMSQINSLLGSLLLEHHYNRIPIDFNHKNYKEYERIVSVFMSNIIELLRSKSEKL